MRKRSRQPHRHPRLDEIEQDIRANVKRADIRAKYGITHNQLAGIAYRTRSKMLYEGYRL